MSDETDQGAQGEQPTIVGKLALCGLLQWSPARLDRLLQRETDFPVATRGGRGVAWEFDLDQVLDFLKQLKIREEEAAAAKQDERADDPGEQRLHVQAERIEHRARALAAQYVEVAGMADTLRQMFGLLDDFVDELRVGLAARALPDGAAEDCVEPVVTRIGLFRRAAGRLLGKDFERDRRDDEVKDRCQKPSGCPAERASSALSPTSSASA